MRLSSARSHSAAALLLLGSLTAALGQFAGSIGDGFSNAGSIHMSISGQQAPGAPYSAGSLTEGGDGYSREGVLFVRIGAGTNASPAYSASETGGDGYAMHGVRYFPLTPVSPGTLAVYKGSDTGGDGFDVRGLIMRTLTEAPLPFAVYRGSSTGGDGYDAGGFTDVPVGGDAYAVVLFRGSDQGGDGYDVDGTVHASINTAPAPLAMFTAGESGGDGYDLGGTHHAALTSATAALAMFISSDAGGDGYDVDGSTHISLNGSTDFASPVFTASGPGGDGYDMDGLRHFEVSPALINGAIAYTGGGGDGYDTRGLIFVQYLGGGEAASGITYEGWLNSRFNESEMNSGLADVAADADGDGLPNLMEFALGADPRVADAAFYGPKFRLSNLSDFGLAALSDHHLTAVVRPNSLALDASLTAEVGDQTERPWSRNDVIKVSEAPGVMILRDRMGISHEPRRFMRFRATLNKGR